MSDERHESGKRKYYNNPNGYLEIEEILRMMMNGTWDSFLSGHSVTRDKCNIVGMKPTDTMCFYCMECFNNTISKIKEYKDYYKFRNKKYMKADLLNHTLDGLENLEVE